MKTNRAETQLSKLIIFLYKNKSQLFYPLAKITILSLNRSKSAIVSNVKKLIPVLSSKSVLQISTNIPFKKILKKIAHNKKADVVVLEKPNPIQMTAVIFSRLRGKKFLWIQNFSNPPVPGFYTKLLLNQSDIILVKSKKMAAKLHSFGVDKPKIRIGK